ncbi:hypothetical protein SAMN05444338_104117 [Flavobacterium degerlachei]|uniref:Uncharacterized protein n=1 Tax=Flavobacterium degerlachei TaxID=229203 RepID=A0A1H2VNJ1_9FLAO|nr:hypothetical protein SAMN05444338_104117 [Flavobacterium degerlachei]
MTELSPRGISTYKGLDTLKQTVTVLQKNYLSVSKLYILC